MTGRIQAKKLGGPGGLLDKWAELPVCRVPIADSLHRDKMQQLWQICRDDSGASLVEFTVSAAVLFMALFGIIQCSLGLYAYNYVSDAAREGTRYAMVRGARVRCADDGLPRDPGGYPDVPARAFSIRASTSIILW